jgi:hypothetical protein
MLLKLDGVLNMACIDGGAIVLSRYRWYFGYGRQTCLAGPSKVYTYFAARIVKRLALFQYKVGLTPLYHRLIQTLP